MKMSDTPSIQLHMTYSNRTWTLFQASLLVAIGCSSRIEVAEPGTGGAPSSTGGAALFGGATSASSGGQVSTGFGGWGILGGQASTGTGGSIAVDGGYPATGGMATGGMATGGMATGGMATGGAPWQGTGGAPRPGVCTPGADQTCNQELDISTLWGHCEDDGSCTCGNGYVLNRNSGKCTTYDQTVCYSPTQNIDLAYVDRAFGCRCDPNTAVPFCGIDSNGLQVYLDCQAFDQSWHSASTTYCNGSDPVPCFSPTRNAESALVPNALGCSCFQTGLQQCVPLGTGAGSSSLQMICTLAGRWEATHTGC